MVLFVLWSGSVNKRNEEYRKRILQKSLIQDEAHI